MEGLEAEAITLPLRWTACFGHRRAVGAGGALWSPFRVAGALLATVGAPLAGLGELGAARAR